MEQRLDNRHARHRRSLNNNLRARRMEIRKTAHDAQ